MLPRSLSQLEIGAVVMYLYARSWPSSIYFDENVLVHRQMGISKGPFRPWTLLYWVSIRGSSCACVHCRKVRGQLTL